MADFRQSQYQQQGGDMDADRFRYSTAMANMNAHSDNDNQESSHSSTRGYGNESFMASGAGLLQSGIYSNRATEMKLTALAPEPGLPAERPRDYKGRYRVRQRRKRTFAIGPLPRTN